VHSLALPINVVCMFVVDEAKIKWRGCEIFSEENFRRLGKCNQVMPVKNKKVSVGSLCKHDVSKRCHRF
jgi:hypothetical protein